ncbi:hypothetical protein [Pollutimonas harenae]|uniref:Uncharacterized protein n=1 Tax=Pollutimonas harenae TaxID=657015 RepID=A0A853GP30_9BURK|nr:hypothetical protein [Pollutimonas harenae]NYT84788.1 hypothetical protein [Pollutimonas harenae]TEA72813.1 hypothetical protein ERD84_02575 [Pollutimonas harenae]
MSQPYLIIEQEAYELRLDDKLLTRMAGGAASLLAGGGLPLREIDIETAIERAEDWLMPFSKLFEGLQLKVRDGTDRLRSHFGDLENYSVEQVEQAFTNAHYDVVHMRANDSDSVADIVLLRELAHHGKLSGVVLDIAGVKLK